MGSLILGISLELLNFMLNCGLKIIFFSLFHLTGSLNLEISILGQ